MGIFSDMLKGADKKEKKEKKKKKKETFGSKFGKRLGGKGLKGRTTLPPDRRR
jgi:hypothetical protein